MSTALILSGGGAKGAFTVGALSFMMKERPDISFDIISGTSTGALIAALVTVGKIDLLRQIYTHVTNDDIIRKQDPGVIFRNNQPFFFSDAPLTNMIEEHITEDLALQIIQSPKKLFLTAMNLQSGRITVFSNKAIQSTAMYDVRQILDRKLLIAALRASSNQAAFLPPVSITKADGKTEQFIDGGNREVIPCLAVIDQNPSTVFVLSNNPKHIFPIEKIYTSVLDVLMRTISIFIQDVRENDLVALEKWRENRGTDVTIHYIEPVKDLDPDFPTGLRFEPGRMGVMMAQGEIRARGILATLVTSSRVLAPTFVESNGIVLHQQCIAITLQNQQCKNTALEGSTLCRVHQK